MIQTINLVSSWIVLFILLAMKAFRHEWIETILIFLGFVFLFYILRIDLTESLVYISLIIIASMFILSSTSQSNVTEKFENEEGKEDEPFIDVGKTFLEAYRSLSPKQIENMTSDTKELIDTQKALLQTIQSLAPIVTEGRQMLQSFQSTFGDQQSIMNQIKNAKSLLGFNNASKKEEDEQFSNS